MIEQRSGTDRFERVMEALNHPTQGAPSANDGSFASNVRALQEQLMAIFAPAIDQLVETANRTDAASAAAADPRTCDALQP